MATDVDVQYFSHLNGLTLGNNWGDLIRLLDKTLVTGIDFTQITQATIDERGDVHITLYSAHNAMLFQIVELSGFTPNSLNQKYRIKGTPSATELILKPSVNIVEKSVTTRGTGKLASLGYDIIYRDTGDIKRVYRAKNPRAEHPFIRVDESLTSPDGTSGVYTSSYAKSAMVGLLENMTHIDDYQDTSKLQLPLDTTDFTKNWKISGTGTGCKRGWSRWYWARRSDVNMYATDAESSTNGPRSFSLAGDKNAFYLQTTVSVTANGQLGKIVNGAGLFNSALDSAITKNWFLMSSLLNNAASENFSFFYNANTYNGVLPLAYSDQASKFHILKYDQVSIINNQIFALPILPNYASGSNGAGFQKNNVSALEIPFSDSDGFLRGALNHICYAGKNHNVSSTTPILSEKSMYITDSAFTVNLGGGFYYYLGELE